MTNRRGSRKSPLFVSLFLAGLLAAPFSIEGRGGTRKPAADMRPLWTFDTGG